MGVSVRSSILFGVVFLPACYLSHGLEDTRDAEVDASSIDAPSIDVFDAGDASLVDASPDVLTADASPDVFDAGDAGCTESPEVCGLVASLDGLRWELPCEGDTAWDEVCATGSEVDDETVFAPGLRGRSFDVTLRFRGVVEPKEYTGGTTRGHFNIGGRPDSTNWNTYSLLTSSPERTYYLNAGARESYVCEAIDITETIRIDGASAVTLRATVFDARQIRNGSELQDPLVIDGVPPSPLPYDGQFIQMDVISIVER